MEKRGRASCDQRDPVKIVEIDTYRPYSNSVPCDKERSYCGYKPHHFNNPFRLSLSSSGYRAQEDVSMAMTPPPSKMKQGEVHSASPRCAKSSLLVPNYMAATESAKARSRSQSAPRYRNSTSTPEKDRTGSVKKRLSFPVPDSHGGVANGGGFSSRNSHNDPVLEGGGPWVDQNSNMSPPHDLIRRWMR